MNAPENNSRVDYIEFAVSDVPSTKKFYPEVLGWTFEDYGPDYTSFHDGRIAGGFFKPEDGKVETGGPLVVIYSTIWKITSAKWSPPAARSSKTPLNFPVAGVSISPIQVDMS